MLIYFILIYFILNYFVLFYFDLLYFKLFYFHLFYFALFRHGSPVSPRELLFRVSWKSPKTPKRTRTYYKDT